MTAAELLRTVGLALWGESHWRSEMAAALDVGDRPLRRWIAGETEPPLGVWRDLLALVVERRAELAALVPHLEERGSDDSVSQGKP